MKLQTTIPLRKSEQSICYESKLLLLGSCFVENIGEKLGYYKFQQEQNPFGILFHPIAIENLLQRALHDKFYKEDEVFEREDIWHCFDAHSSCSAVSKKELLNNLNTALKKTKNQIVEATHIVITLGTAWIYRSSKENRIVANCHKVPQSEFTKELLSVKAILDSLNRMIAMVESFNNDAKLIFTVSPVRHLKDGFVENQRSKSHLITALHQVLESKDTAYFPSYEIMMDELRDYRFYDKDLIHPNALAVDYIWEKFKSVWISEDAFPIMEKVEAIQKGLSHRPFNPNSDSHQKFSKSLEAKIAYLQKKYAFMNF